MCLSCLLFCLRKSWVRKHFMTLFFLVVSFNILMIFIISSRDIFYYCIHYISRISNLFTFSSLNHNGFLNLHFGRKRISFLSYNTFFNFRIGTVRISFFAAKMTCWFFFYNIFCNSFKLISSASLDLTELFKSCIIGFFTWDSLISLILLGFKLSPFSDISLL